MSFFDLMTLVGVAMMAIGGFGLIREKWAR